MWLYFKIIEKFTVFSEVGYKKSDRILAPSKGFNYEKWTKRWFLKVIAEARESGTVGVFRKDGDYLI